MAFVLDPNRPEDQQPAGTIIGSSQGSQRGPTESGQFTNFQNVVQANLPQAQAFGERITGQVEEGFSPIEGGLERARQTLASDEDIVSRAFEDPQRFISREDDLGRFSQLRGGGVQRPNLSEAIAQVPIQRQRVEQLGTQPGRQAQIRQISRNPRQGNIALDEFLLSRAPGFQENVAGLQSRLNALDQLVGGFEVPNFQDQIRQRLTGAQENLRGQVEAARSAAQADALSQANQRLADIAQAVSQSPQRPGRLDPLAPQPFKSIPLELTASRAASPELAAQEAALESLAGQPLDIITEPQFAGQVQPSIDEFLRSPEFVNLLRPLIGPILEFRPDVPSEVRDPNVGIDPQTGNVVPLGVEGAQPLDPGRSIGVPEEIALEDFLAREGFL